ncbi:MAG: nuclear transport factor 2 family protein [Alphaproteobacteria bacterium]|nr:nuclear transport factor 2 family protein [Alphaproteobacteria bacterium]MBU1513087.1 nuclear transport factor 2 family protein [Alphaproteobacteria bacterium]MBU2095195.1 nuclear transport factor 2 family protein [Alphaproteobacteria bacterium]MBU2150646.1 nuclear transport factor 2 family protein [Alphaproteobacteria bacterium]MBU2306095.1 nuclear transport factor 2 family protein [Alphaproteobacteria bacterium]
MSLDRRTLISAAAATGALAAASPALAKESSMPRLFPVLEAIIAAWKKQDVEGVLACVTDDIVWRNSSGYAPAIKGKAAMRTALNTMKAAIKPGSNTWRIFDYAESADRLFMEGVDEFDLTTGQHVAIPYAGSLQFRGALVSEWREYFDGRISSDMKAGKPMSAEVTEMLDRPLAK